MYRTLRSIDRILMPPKNRRKQRPYAAAKRLTDAWKGAQMELFRKQAKEVDIIITTALIPSKPAPKLILKVPFYFPELSTVPANDAVEGLISSSSRSPPVSSSMDSSCNSAVDGLVRSSRQLLRDVGNGACAAGSFSILEDQ